MLDFSRTSRVVSHTYLSHNLNDNGLADDVLVDGLITQQRFIFIRIHGIYSTPFQEICGILYDVDLDPAFLCMHLSVFFFFAFLLNITEIYYLRRYMQFSYPKVFK